MVVDEWMGGKAAAGRRTGEQGGVHRFGVLPKGDANFAWVQDFSRHVAPQGMTEVGSVCLRFALAVLANGSMSSNRTGEGDIRRALIDAYLLDCMVTLRGHLFYSMRIPVCLWFLPKNKGADDKRGFPDRRKDVLFISHKPTFINFSNN